MKKEKGAYNEGNLNAISQRSFEENQTIKFVFETEKLHGFSRSLEKTTPQLHNA
jgi:hypothetical protein